MLNESYEYIRAQKRHSIRCKNEEYKNLVVETFRHYGVPAIPYDKGMYIDVFCDDVRFGFIYDEIQNKAEG